MRPRVRAHVCEYNLSFFEFADTLAIELFENSAEICGVINTNHFRCLIGAKSKVFNIGFGKIHSIICEVINNSCTFYLLKYRVEIVGRKAKLLCNIGNAYLFSVIFGDHFENVLAFGGYPPKYSRQ